MKPCYKCSGDSTHLAACGGCEDMNEVNTPRMKEENWKEELKNIFTEKFVGENNSVYTWEDYMPPKLPKLIENLLTQFAELLKKKYKIYANDMDKFPVNNEVIIDEIINETLGEYLK